MRIKTIAITVDEFLSKGLDVDDLPNDVAKVVLRTPVTHMLEDITNPSTLGIFAPYQVRSLVKKARRLKELGIECEFYEGFSVLDAIYASRKLESWANKINNANIGGQELSPYEKFLYAYDIATSFAYDRNKDKSGSQLVFALKENSFICWDFASLLAALCKKIGIYCTTFSIPDKDYDSHGLCAVALVDKKYGINGLYFADPTFDCKHHERTSRSIDWCNVAYRTAKVDYNRQTYTFTYDIVQEVLSDEIFTPDKKREIIYSTPIINSKTTETALTNVFFASMEDRKDTYQYQLMEEYVKVDNKAERDVIFASNMAYARINDMNNADFYDHIKQRYSQMQ